MAVLENSHYFVTYEFIDVAAAFLNGFGLYFKYPVEIFNDFFRLMAFRIRK